MEQHPSGPRAAHGLRVIEETDFSWIVDLNRLLEVELSPLTTDDLARLISNAFYARAATPREGFLLALDHDADYASPNFLWFRRRLARFVYVDRIAIVKSARGRGVARRLYLDLFEQARAAGHTRIVCEVNIDPPNSASDAFHAGFKFTEIGRADISANKSVRYMTKVL